MNLFGKLRRFHGGIHPPLNKARALGQPVQACPLPPRLILPLVQYGGNTATAIVKPGMKVRKGQLLARANGPLSVNIHAPAAGHILSIADRVFPHPSQSAVPSIMLETGDPVEHANTTADIYPPFDPDALPEAELLLERIREAGICGLGGAGFPTGYKLTRACQTGIDTLIINAAECEPSICADEALLQERAETVCLGIRILQQLLSPRQCLIGIEDSKPLAIAALQAATAGTDIQVKIIPTRYPSGSEKQLIRILTGREVPSGRTPQDIGILCQNPATCLAIHDAIVLGQPLISRVITVTGDAVGKPCNMEVPLGTPVAHLLQISDTDDWLRDKLIHGGPLMGFLVEDDSMPVTAISNCLIAASTMEIPEAKPEQDCIRCGFCAEVCPAGLLPQQLLFHSQQQKHELAQAEGLFDCIECGACNYVCPSNIPLVQYYRASKGLLREEQADRQRAQHWQQRFEFRQLRVGQAQQDRLARRKRRQQQTDDNNAKPAAAGKSAAELQQEIMAAVARSKARKADRESGNNNPS